MPLPNTNSSNEAVMPNDYAKANRDRLINDTGRQSSVMNDIQQKFSGFSGAGNVAQAGAYRAFGNNVVTQGAMAGVGALGSLVEKIAGMIGNSSDNDDIGSSGEVSEFTQIIDSSKVLQAMLSSLLRIEKLTGQQLKTGASGGSGGASLANKKIVDELEKDRKQSEKFSEELKKALTNGKKPDGTDILQSRASNVTATAFAGVQQGMFGSMGSNVLTQSIMEGFGAAGDSLKSLFGKGKKTDKIDPELAVAKDGVKVAKESKGVLDKILVGINGFNEKAKKFFEDKPLSDAETNLEAAEMKKSRGGRNPLLDAAKEKAGPDGTGQPVGDKIFGSLGDVAGTLAAGATGLLLGKKAAGTPKTVAGKSGSPLLDKAKEAAGPEGKGSSGKLGGKLVGVAKNAMKGGIGAVLGAGVGLGADILAEDQEEKGNTKTAAGLKVAGTAASYAGTGAMIGSIIPGVGTALGAGAGAVLGAGVGLWENRGAFFGGEKTTEDDAQNLAKKADEVRNPPSQSEAKTVNANTTNVVTNNQTVIGVRKPVRNEDLTANRYIDSVLSK